MKPNPNFSKLATAKQIQRTVKTLQANGFKAEVVANGQEAEKKVLKLIPQGAEVFTMSSQTLEAIGIAKEINESGRYEAVRPKLMSMDSNTQAREMRKLAAAPDFVIGSVHAVTEDGKLLIVSNSGSQLGSYAYAGGKVIFVLGTQKIVKNVDEGIRRINEYSYPLEDERAQKAYGMRSGVNKLLIINKEINPERIHIILVKENLGF